MVRVHPAAPFMIKTYSLTGNNALECFRKYDEWTGRQPRSYLQRLDNWLAPQGARYIADGNIIFKSPEDEAIFILKYSGNFSNI